MELEVASGHLLPNGQKLAVGYLEAELHRDGAEADGLVRGDAAAILDERLAGAVGGLLSGHRHVEEAVLEHQAGALVHRAVLAQLLVAVGDF